MLERKFNRKMVIKIPIEISARHIHLCQKDLEKLFGRGYQLKKLRNLTQPGQFAAKETVNIKKGKKGIENVRIVGPLRSKTQVELSLTDAIFLRIKIPIRKSGNLKGSPGILIVGPKGKLRLKEGVICPWRHIHLSKKDAEKLNLKEGDLVQFQVKGKRGLIFNNVMIRVSEDFRTCLHLDTDEGNACGISEKSQGTLIIPNI